MNRNTILLRFHICKTIHSHATLGESVDMALEVAHGADELIAGELQGDKELAIAALNARVIPSVAYTDPKIAWVGLTEDQPRPRASRSRQKLMKMATSSVPPSIEPFGVKIGWRSTSSEGQGDT